MAVARGMPGQGKGLGFKGLGFNLGFSKLGSVRLYRHVAPPSPGVCNFATCRQTSDSRFRLWHLGNILQAKQKPLLQATEVQEVSPALQIHTSPGYLQTASVCECIPPAQTKQLRRQGALLVAWKKRDAQRLGDASGNQSCEACQG